MDLLENLQAEVLAYFDALPDELVMSILSRLPVKTVVQSTCVCKRWYSIIKTPAFISAHLSHSISNDSNCNILVSYTDTSKLNVPKLYLFSDSKFLSHHANLKIPSETWFKYVSVVGCCHGLVCLAGCLYYGLDIYLVNPSIQKYRMLTREFSCYADLLGKCCIGIDIGFGYSDRQNDYKVVRTLVFDGPDGWSKAEVYSLKSGKWKVIDAPIDQMHQTMVFANGCLYWLSQHGYNSYSLHCFDLDEEVFRRIEFPATYYELCNEGYLRILQKDGSLALFGIVAGNFGTDSCNNRTGYKLCIFVMGKDSSGQVQWKEKEYYFGNEEHKDLLYTAVGLSSSNRLISRVISCQHIPLTITAINLNDLSTVEKLWLDTADNDSFIAVEMHQLDTDNDTFNAIEKLQLDTDNDTSIADDYYGTDSESDGEYTVDTNFIESLTLFLGLQSVICEQISMIQVVQAGEFVGSLTCSFLLFLYRDLNG